MDYQKMISDYKIRILMAKNRELETNKVINEILNISDIKDSEKEIILTNLHKELYYYFPEMSIIRKIIIGICFLMVKTH